MTLFYAGLVLFFLTHSMAVVTPGLRQQLIDRLGDAPFKGLYSVVSIVTFAMLIWGYGYARPVTPVLYSPPMPLKHTSLLIMIPVFPLLFSTYLPGRIKAAVKHPMLTAIKTWALAHLLSNGTLADLLLFGGFLAWAVVVRISLKRRPTTTAAAPATGSVVNDILAVVLGLGMYVAFIFGVHQWLFGVPPIASLAR